MSQNYAVTISANHLKGTGMTDERPFDDVRALAHSVPERDSELYADLIERSDTLGRNLRPLGTLAAPLARIPRTNEIKKSPQMHLRVVASS